MPKIVSAAVKAKAMANAWTFEAKAWTFEVKAKAIKIGLEVPWGQSLASKRRYKHVDKLLH